VDELRCSCSQLGLETPRDAVEAATALRGEDDSHGAAVPSGTTGDESARLHAVDQFDGAVMPELHALGNLTDRGCAGTGKSTDGQQQLVLLGFETDLASCGLRYPQVFPYLESKIRPRGVVEPGCRCHTSLNPRHRDPD